MALNKINVLVDSNIWIGLFHISDALHEQSKAVFKSLEQRDCQAVISSFIIQEVFTLLTNKVSHDEAVRFYHFIRQHQRIDHIDVNSDFIFLTIKFIEHNKLTAPLGLTDYSNLYLADAFGFELMSFDQKLMAVYQQLSE